MTDATPTPSSDLPPERPGPPPLRIHHIFACIAVTALLFTMVRISLHRYGHDPKYISGANGIVFVITSGIALTFVVYGIAWRRRGLEFFHQPGHWLLLFYLDSIAYFVLSFLDVVIPHSEPASGMTWLYATGSSVISLAVLVGSFAAWLGFQSRWWRAYFLLQGLKSVFLPALALWSSSRETLWAIQNAILLSLLTAAAVADWRHGRQRDWVNWTGVVLTTFMLARGIAVSLWPWLGSWPN